MNEMNLSTELIVKQVLNGEINRYESEVNGRMAYRLFKGNKRCYGKWDVEAPGLTMHLATSMGYTIVYAHNHSVEELVDTLMSQYDAMPGIIEQANLTAKYLSSDEGKWGR